MDPVIEYKKRRKDRVDTRLDAEWKEEKHKRDASGKFAPSNSKDVDTVENKETPRLNGKAKKSLTKVKSQFKDDPASAVFDNVPSLIKNLGDKQGFKYSYRIGDDTWTATVQRWGSKRNGKPLYTVHEECGEKKHDKDGSYEDISDDVCFQMTEEDVIPDSIEEF